MLDSESIRVTPDQLALTNIARNRTPAGGLVSLGRENLRTMHRILSLSLLVLAFAASALAAAPDGRPQPLTKAFPTYTNRSENPEVWDGIAEALIKAGLPNAIAVIRVRESGVWSADVDLQPMSGQLPLRAVVSFDLNKWKVLCFTSEVQDCSKYGR